MSNERSYRKAIDLHNSGTRVPAASLVRENPKVAAVLSKLVIDPRSNNSFNGKGQRHMQAPHTAQFRQTAMQTAQNISDAETVNQVLPDTDLAAQILVSSILSPKDMMQVSLTYASAEGKWKLPQEVSMSLINKARDHFEQVYKIKPLLPKILRDILFRTGSYSIAVIPENAVDDLINNTGEIKMESFSSFMTAEGNMRPMGLLGPRDDELKNQIKARTSPGLALESLYQYEADKTSSGKVMFNLPALEGFPDREIKSVNAFSFDPLVAVTDNFNLLKVPELNERIRQNRVREILGGRAKVSVESIAERYAPKTTDPTKMPDRKIINAVYKQPRIRHQLVVSLKSQDKLARRSIGSPLVMHLPAEAIIPVHVPNRPDRQIGFFIMIDQEGNPISKADSADYYKELTQRAGAGDSFVSSMLERSRQALNDSMGMNPRAQIDYSAMVYGQMLEDDLNQRLRNGLVGGNAVIAKNEEVYRLMMARSLQQQHTQLLYIPAEFMTYMAFRYHSNGIGKSLLEDGKILNSMRTMLLVANVMASLRNSIGRTNVNLKLDPDSTDPMKNIEQSISEIMRVNSTTFPLGSNNPNDIVESMQRAAFQFSFTGHPGVPDMDIEFSERNSAYAKPDSELEDTLRKRAIMMYGLTPEMVDAAAGSDFASSVNNNSTLLSKRVLTYQEEFVPQIADHLRKYMINTADLMEEYLEIVEEAFEDIIKNLSDEKIKMVDGREVTKEDLKTNPLYKAFMIKEILEEFIENFVVKLPEPDMTRIDNENDAYQKYEQLLEQALNAWISDEMFTSGELGTATDHIKTVRTQIKAYFLREWQMRNGVLPELAKITAKGDDGEVEIDFQNAQSEHVKGLLKAVEGLFKNIKTAKEKTDKVLENAGLDASSTGYGGTSDYGSDGGDSGGFGDTGGFGDDAGAGGDDGGFGDTTGGDAGGFGDVSLDEAGGVSMADPAADPDAPGDIEGLDGEAGDPNAAPEEGDAGGNRWQTNKTDVVEEDPAPDDVDPEADPAALDDDPQSDPEVDPNAEEEETPPNPDEEEEKDKAKEKK